LLFKLSGQRPEILSMKILTVLLFLSVLVGYQRATADENELKEIILPGEEFSLEAANESNITKQNNQRQIDIYNLQKAKFKLIGGDLKLAEFYLSRISDDESFIVSIKKKYLAVIYFINGQFDKSVAELNHKEINKSSYYTQNCLLRLINYMALNDMKGLSDEHESCRVKNLKYSKNELFWLDAMVKLKFKDKEGLDKNLLVDINDTIKDEEMSKLWLKAGLYLNREKNLIKLLEFLPDSSYQSKRLREIIAFMYLRSGDAKKAVAFVDDIDTANAENIKGNVNLQNKEYELAFGHFRLALQKKQDSANALERAIPLAWILGQWADGLSMMDNISNKSLDQRNKTALKIAFMIREKKFVEAQRELILLKIAFKNEPPPEVTIMETYVNLMIGEKERAYDKRKLEETTERACKFFDGMSCWMALQYTQWDNLGKTIKRDDPIFTDNSMTVDSLKEKKTIEPLAELKTVDQNDIEELDGETIRISPK
ncbi:MAG: hypothetical protein K2Q18_04050, partial [Bdellovibrionales bacterium]|nr:hypothetical protein [Bdellovibrionales bacterium]